MSVIRGAEGCGGVQLRRYVEAKNFGLKAVNPDARREQDTRTPEELLDLIEVRGREVSDALTLLRGRTTAP